MVQLIYDIPGGIHLDTCAKHMVDKHILGTQLSEGRLAEPVL